MKHMRSYIDGQRRDDDSFVSPGLSSFVTEQPASTAIAPKLKSISLLQATQAVVLISGTLGIAYAGRPVLMPLLLAWVISMALKPTVRWLSHHGVPTTVAAAMVLGSIVLATGLSAYYLVQPSVAWMQQAPENMPKLRAKFDHILKPAAKFSAAASSMSELGSTNSSTNLPQKVEIQDHRVADFLFARTGNLLALAGETFALVFLLLASGNSFTLKIVRLMPTFHEKKHAVEVVHNVQSQISSYLFAALLVNSSFGLVLGIGVHLLHLPNPIMWGGLAALLNFIPYFGPIFGMLAVGMAGVLAFDSLGHGLLPAVAYLLLHLLEANLITPFIVGKRFTLNPVVIFVSLMAATALWGVVGGILAVPLLVCVKAACDQIGPLREIGYLIFS